VALDCFPCREFSISTTVQSGSAGNKVPDIELTLVLGECKVDEDSSTFVMLLVSRLQAEYIQVVALPSYVWDSSEQLPRAHPNEGAKRTEIPLESTCNPITGMLPLALLLVGLYSEA
jgi:hypothetical protein